MKYIFCYLEHSEALWFWLVCLSRPKIKKHFLWDSVICVPWDTERKLLRLKDRYMVGRYYDVWNADRGEPIQNNFIRRVNKNNKRCGFIPFLPEYIERGKRFRDVLLTEKPKREEKREIALNPRFLQEVSIEIK